MTEVKLRPASAEDAPRIAEIWYSGWHDGHVGNVPDRLVAVRTKESFSRRAIERVADMTVAEVEGNIAGFIAVVDDEVEHVYVAWEFRGKGVAAFLLAEAERQVASEGYDEGWLAVAAGNTRARRFYQRCGWEDRGVFEYDAYSESGPIRISPHRYTKRLKDDTAL